MPVVPRLRKSSDLVFSLGGLPPPPDVVDRDRPYRASRTAPILPGAVNLSEPRLLARYPYQGKTIDARYPDLDKVYQGQIGSCASVSTEVAEWMLGQMAGRRGHELGHFGWKYEQARRLRGWYPQDSGSYVADNCDIAMPGTPRLSRYRYVEDAAFDYPNELDTERELDYLAGHRPFYPSEGQFIETVWAALDRGEVVVFSSYWPDPWFSPKDGKMPENVTPGMARGSHAYVITGIVPSFFLSDGSWSTGFSPDGAAFGYDQRPGSVAIPWSAVQRGIIHEGRALTREPFTPVPDPVDPKPQPIHREYADAVQDAQEETLRMQRFAADMPEKTERRWWAVGGEWVFVHLRDKLDAMLQQAQAPKPQNGRDLVERPGSTIHPPVLPEALSGPAEEQGEASVQEDPA